MTLFECKDHPLLIFCIYVAFEEINDEWKGGRMCQHVCNGGPRCTDKAKAQVGC